MNRASHRWLTHVVLFATLVPAILNTSVAASALTQSETGVVLGPRGDAGLTGAMPGAGPSTQPTIQWEVPADGVIMGMAIRGDLLYFAAKDPGTVTAVERGGGAVAWTTNFGEDSTVFGPEPAGDVIVVGVWASDANAIVALDAATGTERWRVTTDNLPTAPTHVGSTVYVAAEGGLSAESGLYALDAATGAQRWTFAAPEALDLGERVSVSDGIVVASAWSLEDNGIGVYALDGATGEVLWRFTEADELNMEPIVGNGIVLVTDLPRTWALDLRTGATRWNHGGQSTGGGPAMDSNAAYFGYGDEVQAVSLQDGSPLWSSPVSGIAGPPVIAEGRVYTAVWKRSDDPSNHWLHAFDAASGAEVWSLELEHRVTGNEPLADGGVLYVDTNSSVVAFGSEPVTAGATATEAANAGGAYTSEAFGYTITWVSPWRLSKPQSTASDTRDTVTLLTGDARLAMSATTDVASSAEMIRFYASTVGTSRPNAEVVQIDESAELSRATMRFTIDDTPYMEYVEIRPLPAGNGIFMTVLTGPAEWFGLAFQAGQQLVAIDQQPPFRVGPASSAG